MNVISNFSKNFEFSDLSLAHPTGLQGGSFFSKLSYKDDVLYTQLPKCLTKQGIVSSGKKQYCDLMFTQDDENILQWFENLEQKIQQLIFDKRNSWFHNDLEIEDIENAFSATIRTYKSGKYFIVRTNLQTIKNYDDKPFICYDENEIPLNISTIEKQKTKIIPLLEIQGIKFSSKSFHLEICLRQLMVLNESKIFSSCLIKNNSSLTNEQSSSNSLLNNDKENDVKENNVEVNDVEENDIEENDVEENNVEENDVEENDNKKLENTSTSIQEKILDSREENEKNLNNNENKKENNLGNLCESENDKLEENDLEKNKNTKELIEITDLNLDKDMECIKLKEPNEVYISMWREARTAAKQAKKEAIMAYARAKDIKSTYMLEEIENSSDDELDTYLENNN